MKEMHARLKNFRNLVSSVPVVKRYSVDRIIHNLCQKKTFFFWFFFLILHSEKIRIKIMRWTFLKIFLNILLTTHVF